MTKEQLINRIFIMILNEYTTLTEFTKRDILDMVILGVNDNQQFCIDWLELKEE